MISNTINTANQHWIMQHSVKQHQHPNQQVHRLDSFNAHQPNEEAHRANTKININDILTS